MVFTIDLYNMLKEIYTLTKQNTGNKDTIYIQIAKGKHKYPKTLKEAWKQFKLNLKWL